jgi:hypothetical protein
VGRWIQCSSRGVGPDDGVGFEVAGDGRYVILIRDTAGAIVRGKGLLYEGHVHVSFGGVDFAGDDNATELTDLSFSDATLSRVFTVNTDFIGYDYTREAAPAAACATPIGSRVWPETEAMYRGLLTGRWERCGRALTSDDSEVGLEITADGRWNVLVRDADGATVPSTSPFAKGKVNVMTYDPSDGHASFGVTFESDLGPMLGLTPLFTDNVPRQWVVLNTDFIAQRYVLVGP